HGVVNGNVTVEQRCELKTDAELVGDLKAPRLIIEEGATFVGRSEVTPKTATIQQGSGKPAVPAASARA
ncbi:MAG: polymer-forming cytoskeletal protein, partial [Chthoniobacteraceae bacterium]